MADDHQRPVQDKVTDHEKIKVAVHDEELGLPQNPRNRADGPSVAYLAREDSIEDLQRLLNETHPPVPRGWDYLTLPRRVNLARVQKPTVVIKDDYYTQAKQIVRIDVSNLSGLPISSLWNHLSLGTTSSIRCTSNYCRFGI